MRGIGSSDDHDRLNHPLVHADHAKSDRLAMLRTMTRPRPSSLHGIASPQFLRYVLAGATGTAVHYAVLIALVQLASIGAVAATTAGAVCGALVNYRLNHGFTFASERAHKHALPRFALVTVFGIAVNAAVFALLLPWVAPYYLLAQIAATGVVLISGYLINRAWTF